MGRQRREGQAGRRSPVPRQDGLQLEQGRERRMRGRDQEHLHERRLAIVLHCPSAQPAAAGLDERREGWNEGVSLSVTLSLPPSLYPLFPFCWWGGMEGGKGIVNEGGGWEGGREGGREGGV